MKIFIKTYGCQANIADSERMAGILESRGHEIVGSENEADKIIVNSCSVKNKTQSKILHYIREQVADKEVYVGGCLTKTLKVDEHVPLVRGVFDTNSIMDVEEVLVEGGRYFSDKKENRVLSPIIRKDKKIGIVPIGEGCLNNCTFCATKLSRGNLKSYRIGDIKRAVEKAVNEGCEKIYLTSQDNGCYGKDIGTNLPELLNEVVQVKGDYKIRVGMMNPWHLRKILSLLIKSFRNNKIMKFIHIPVQSGSEKVLKDMKRIHTVEEFKEVVKVFRANFSEVTIATDVIVGYPTESEEDFQMTLDLVSEIKPEVINKASFSSRPGTAASKLKKIPTEIIKNRTRRLDKLYIDYRKELEIRI